MLEALRGSPPTWGRGLKPHLGDLSVGSVASPPTWGRGLKRLGIASALRPA